MNGNKLGLIFTTNLIILIHIDDPTSIMHLLSNEFPSK